MHARGTTMLEAGIIGAAFEAMPVAIYITDRDGALLACNRSAISLFGTHPTYGTPGFVADGLLFHGDGSKLIYDTSPAAICLRTGAAAQVRGLTIRRHDRTSLTVRADAVPVVDPDGRIHHVVTTLIETEATAEQLNAHYRAALELSPLVHWIADMDGVIPGTGIPGLDGMRRNEIGFGGRCIEPLHPADRDLVLEKWRQSTRTGTPFDTEFRVSRPEGDLWHRARAVARRDESGRILNWHGSTENIHERKLAALALKESEHRAQCILQSSPDCLRLLELDGTVVFVNTTGAQLAQNCGGSELLGVLWQATLPEAYRSEGQGIIELAATGTHARMTICSPMASTFGWWVVTVAPIIGGDGVPTRLLLVAHDVSEQKHALLEVEIARRDAETVSRRLSSVLEGTTDNVIVLDRAMTISYINDNAIRLLKEYDTGVGSSIVDIFPMERNSVFAHYFEHAIGNHVAVEFEAYLAVLGLWIKTHIFPTEDGISIFFQDISERRRGETEQRLAQDRLAHMAMHDALTALPNRTLFRQALHAAMSGDLGNAAVLYLDIDGFKKVNDTLGHKAGDQLLCLIAERLRRSLRHGSTVARLGGDEFAIVQVDVVCLDNATSFATRLIEVISQPYDVDGQKVRVGLSIGIALASIGLSAEALLHQADLALYRAKAKGRGSFCIHDATVADQHTV